MKSSQDFASLSREDLLRLVAEQQRLIDQLQSQVISLSATIEALRAENSQLRRSAKRQAAPFSKGARVSEPKRPGRKPGSGAFSFRQAPQPEEITEPPVDVPVTLEACPECGGALAEERVDPSAKLRTGFAYITDIPEIPRPKVTQYRVWVCRCRGCGQQVRGQHPDPSAGLRAGSGARPVWGHSPPGGKRKVMPRELSRYPVASSLGTSSMRPFSSLTGTITPASSRPGR